MQCKSIQTLRKAYNIFICYQERRIEKPEQTQHFVSSEVVCVFLCRLIKKKHIAVLPQEAPREDIILSSQRYNFLPVLSLLPEVSSLLLALNNVKCCLSNTECCMGLLGKERGKITVPVFPLTSFLLNAVIKQVLTLSLLSPD